MSRTIRTDSNNDLYLDSAGNIAMATRNIDVAAELAQNKLRTFLGEVFTDTTKGLDYFGIIFNDYSNLQDKVNEIARICLQVDLVNSIESIAYSQNKEQGLITFNPVLITVDGSVTIENTVGV
jgi:hypothetical protein